MYFFLFFQRNTSGPSTTKRACFANLHAYSHTEANQPAIFYVFPFSPSLKYFLHIQEQAATYKHTTQA